MNNNLFVREKQEYAAIDYAKFIAALFVVAIHITPLKECSDVVFFWFDQILFRLAVPFFFVASGFWLGKKLDNKILIIRYSKRIIILYVLYTFLYFPQIVYDYIKVGDEERTLLEYFFNKFFLEGSYTQFWYFLALLVAVWILYFLRMLKIKDKLLLFFSFVLYGIGVLKDVYSTVMVGIPVINDLCYYINLGFPLVVNGLFKAYPFVVWGYYIYHHQKICHQKKWIILLGIFFAGMNFEAFQMLDKVGYSGHEFWFATWFVVPVLFLVLCSIGLKEPHIQIGITIRKVSTLIFGFHLFVRFYAHVVFVKILNWNVNSLVYYLLMAVITIVVSLGVLKLSSYKRFSWLKYLY